MRLTLSESMFEASYRCALDILDGRRSRAECISELTQFGGKERTAAAYFDCFIAMRRGRIFKSTVSAEGLRYLLEKIAAVGGVALVTALGAVRAHIEYFEGLPRLNGSKERASNLRPIYEAVTSNLKLEAISALPPEAFDLEVRAQMKRSPEARAQELNKAATEPASFVAFTRVFRRSPVVAAEVLLRANGVCEAYGQPAPFKRRMGRRTSKCTTGYGWLTVDWILLLTA